MTEPPVGARGRRSRLRTFAAGCLTGVAAVLLAVAVIQVSPLPDWLVRPLQRPDSGRDADAIVVLGADSWEPCGPNVSSLARIFKGVELWTAGRAPILVFTGGSTEGSRGAPVSVAMGDLARRLGVPADAVLEETSSRNTWENAILTRRLLDPQRVRRVLVVTDSIHMRRAEGSFLRAGFEVERASVPQVCVSSSNVRMLRQAIHEYVGLAYYSYRGRLSSPP